MVIFLCCWVKLSSFAAIVRSRPFYLKKHFEQRARDVGVTEVAVQPPGLCIARTLCPNPQGWVHGASRWLCRDLCPNHRSLFFPLQTNSTFSHSLRTDNAAADAWCAGHAVNTSL